MEFPKQAFAIMEPDGDGGEFPIYYSSLEHFAGSEPRIAAVYTLVELVEVVSETKIKTRKAKVSK